MKKLFTGLAAAGLFAAAAVFVRNLLARESVDIRLQTGSRDVQELKKACLAELHKRRTQAMELSQETSERQLLAAVFDQTIESIEILDKVQPEASVIYNGLSRSRMERILDAVFGPAVSFLLALAALCVLIGAKWSIETELSGSVLSGLNTALLLSGAAAVHLLIRLIRSWVCAMKDTDYLTIGVELTVPKMDREQYIANRCQSALRNAQAICALLQASAVPSVTDLELLADLYVQMYQAQALADFADVGGYLLPRCKKALRGMGVEIVEGYTPEKEHLFDVTQAPGYGKNIVVRPALVMKDGTDVLSRGEYVRGL